MCRVLVSLLLLAPLLGACAAVLSVPIAAALYIPPRPSLTPDQIDAQFDATLTEMAGANEQQLLGAMGRIPDNSYQLDDQTKLLQWRWDTSYISPSCSPTGSYRGRWNGRYPPSPVHENCLVEWTVSKGTSRWYHWAGYGCRSVTLVSFPVP